MSDSKKCELSLNHLPPFRKNSIIFISNIFSLFFGNELQIKELRKEVGALETYGGRMLPVLNILSSDGNNLLALEKYPNQALFKYFVDLGISLPEIILIPENFYEKLESKDPSLEPFIEKIKNHSAEYVTGYVDDQALKDLAERIGKKTIGSSEGCYRGNNKKLLYEHLKEKKLPTFDVFIAKNSNAVYEAFDQLKKDGYKSAVVKAQVGASGIGMIKVDLGHCENIQLPDYLFYEGEVLVEGWLDASVEDVAFIASPSVQLYVSDICWVYDMTEQILSRQSVHEGNIAPPPFFEEFPEAKQMMLDQAEVAGSWLMEQGYRGTASIDFHVIARDGKVEVRICEINARVTGATYPSVLAKYFAPKNVWLMRNVRFGVSVSGDELIKTLEIAGILFEKGKNSGVLPINFNTDEEDRVVKGQFLFLAPTRLEVYDLLAKMEKELSSHGGYDRD